MPLTNVRKELTGKSIVIRLNNGSDEKGAPMYVNKTFSSISQAASNADLLNTANIIVSLQNKSLGSVLVQDKSMLLIG